METSEQNSQSCIGVKFSDLFVILDVSNDSVCFFPSFMTSFLSTIAEKHAKYATTLPIIAGKSTPRNQRIPMMMKV